MTLWILLGIAIAFFVVQVLHMLVAIAFARTGRFSKINISYWPIIFAVITAVISLLFV